MWVGNGTPHISEFIFTLRKNFVQAVANQMTLLPSVNLVQGLSTGSFKVLSIDEMLCLTSRNFTADIAQNKNIFSNGIL